MGGIGEADPIESLEKFMTFTRHFENYCVMQ